MTAKEKEKFITQILKIIEEKQITTIKGIVSYLPMHRATFYNHDFDKNDIIKDAIDAKKVEMKEALRTKWFAGDNPTLQIALYKLLADKDERDALTNNTNIKVDSNMFDDMTTSDIDKGIETYLPNKQ